LNLLWTFAFEHLHVFVLVFLFLELNKNTLVDVCVQVKIYKKIILFYFKGIENTFNIWQALSQPHFEESVRMRLTLPKWELGCPPRLPKLQSSIVGVKTPHIMAFFISLEIY
jgi:hypothetical protein